MPTIKRKIKVLIVDDSAVARNFIKNGITSEESNIDVIDYAVDAEDAKNKIIALKPDVVTMDVEMPGTNGIDFVKNFLPSNPVPVILVSSLNVRIFEALNAGAVDFVRKPDGIEKRETFLKSLKEKIVVASCANLARVRKPLAPVLPLQKPSEANVGTSLLAQTIASNNGLAFKPDANLDDFIVVLGASTGGTEATNNIIKVMPQKLPGMVIVQHMPAGFTKMYAATLNKMAPTCVKEAQDGDEVKSGVVLIAPAEFQTRVVNKGGKYFVKCTKEDKISGHCPSVDALFMSVAESVKCKAVGVILTGMGADGAKGLLEMRKKGFYTIGQDEQSSIVYGMPKVAYDIGAVKKQVPCESVAKEIIQYINNP